MNLHTSSVNIRHSQCPEGVIALQTQRVKLVLCLFRLSKSKSTGTTKGCT